MGPLSSLKSFLIITCLFVFFATQEALTRQLKSSDERKPLPLKRQDIPWPLNVFRGFYVQRLGDNVIGIFPSRPRTTRRPITSSSTTLRSVAKKEILKKKAQIKKPTLESLKEEGFLIEDLDQRPIEGYCPHGRDPNRKGCLKKKDDNSSHKLKSPGQQVSQAKKHPNNNSLLPRRPFPKNFKQDFL